MLPELLCPVCMCIYIYINFTHIDVLIYQENILQQRAMGIEQAPHGSDQGPMLPEFKGHLDSALRHRI